MTEPLDPPHGALSFSSLDVVSVRVESTTHAFAVLAASVRLTVFTQQAGQQANSCCVMVFLLVVVVLAVGSCA